MVGLQTLDLAIGVRVPASQPTHLNKLHQPILTEQSCFFQFPGAKRAPSGMAQRNPVNYGSRANPTIVEWHCNEY